MRRTSIVAMLTLLALLFANSASAAQRADIVPAPFNPDFVKYLEDARSGKAVDRIPPKPYLSTSTRTTSKRSASRASQLEKSFDLVQKGWVTDVKDQMGWGTCWDFAAMESLESNILKETNKSLNLSELHLGFFAYYDESTKKPAFDANAPADRNAIFDNGGSYSKARAILARGTGPVFDSDCPYPDVDPADKSFWKTFPDDPDALRNELLAAPTVIRLRESLTFHTSDDIKRALKEYGGLWVGFNSGSVKDYADPYLYMSADNKMDHAVMLVGWDDELSRGLFDGKNAGFQSPDIDGGWKIQNSWGVSMDKNGQEILMGDDGYYWISYADVSIFGDVGATSFVAMSADAYKNIYSHDPLGVNFVLEIEDTEVVTANAFTAEHDEDLVYIGLDTEGYDVGYSVQIYKNIPEGGYPDDGTPVYPTPQTGRADFPGYRTIKLTTPVPLYKGERFAVAVTLESPVDLKLPVEARIDNYTSKAEANPGESYVWADDEGWFEVRDFTTTDTDDTDDDDEDDFLCTNLTIKAFTNDANRSYSSSGSGCETGAFALLLLIALPAIMRKR